MNEKVIYINTSSHKLFLGCQPNFGVYQGTARKSHVFASSAFRQQSTGISGDSFTRPVQYCAHITINTIKHLDKKIMALKATIHKAEIIISDMDRGYYHTHALTLAQHPSETLERLMLRLVVFALHANEQLIFTRGLSAVDEPELWQKSATGEIELWIELGEPDERRLRQACGRARQVWLYSYGRGSDVWWKGIQIKITRLKNLRVLRIAQTTLTQLAKLHQRNMQLQATMQDNQLWLSSGDQCVLVEVERLFWMSEVD